MRDAIDEELWARFVAQYTDAPAAYTAYQYLWALRRAWETGGSPALVLMPAVQSGYDLIPLSTAGDLIQAVAAYMNPADASTTLCGTCQVPIVPGRVYCAAHQPAVAPPFTTTPATVEEARLCYRQVLEADRLAPSPLTHRWRAQAQDWLAPFLLGGAPFAYGRGTR